MLDARCEMPDARCLRLDIYTNEACVKYYKGLGTSTSKEAKEYFSDMKRHRILFGYSNMRDDLAIQLAFSKRFVDERKDWLTRYMQDRKVRRVNHQDENYLYQKDTKKITFSDFVNKELVLFSNLDNERSIPCVVDGFKPGQRKVLYSCFKRNLVKELKVAQLAGSVAELSAYHHGEASLMSTIINLAQNYVGSNNINLLLPIGQFGTRLHGGKDAASPRYIFTALSPLTRLLFNPKDDPLFNYLNDDGLKVEPEWYCPIIPTVLVNGAEGIGTGWSTKIPNYNPREIIQNLKRMIKGQDPLPMEPYYKNFRGKIEQLDDVRVLTNGKIAVIEDNTIEITGESTTKRVLLIASSINRHQSLRNNHLEKKACSYFFNVSYRTTGGNVDPSVQGGHTRAVPARREQQAGRDHRLPRVPHGHHRPLRGQNDSRAIPHRDSRWPAQVL